jgi:hypothetical protein
MPLALFAFIYLFIYLFLRQGLAFIPWQGMTHDPQLFQYSFSDRCALLLVEIGGLTNFLLGLAWNCDPPDLHHLSS